jgi:hypothetical protein
VEWVAKGSEHSNCFVFVHLYLYLFMLLFSPRDLRVSTMLVYLSINQNNTDLISSATCLELGEIVCNNIDNRAGTF